MLNQAFNDGSTGHLDTDGDKPWLSSSQFFQTLHQLCDSSPGMLDRFPIDHASIAIDNTHFMVLRCPVNAYKPTILF